MFRISSVLRTASFALTLLASQLHGAVSLDFAVDLQATVSATTPHISLSWTQRVQSSITAQTLSRRLKGETAWTTLATLTTSQTSYADNTALPGVEYEYRMLRTFTALNPNTAIGYLSAGTDVPAIEDRGTLLLVVDNTMTGPLAPEIAQLQQDLAADGWNVQTIPVGRSDTPPTVRGLIQTAYNAAPASVKAVYLLGRVPVPYSGNIAPDGHVPDHLGAWPADVYYGEMTSTWTDTTQNTTGASGTRNDNIPNDGKFDSSSLPSDLELQVGRVDMANMTKFPSSGASETALLRRYLRKAHDYRHRLGVYANIPRRSMIRDGFGHLNSSEPFMASGWATALSVVAKGVSGNVDQPTSGQWFTTAGANSYLWAAGNGGGSNESASSVGNSTEFGRKASRAVFTSLFGSYFGDWDQANNFLRAPLAGTATGDSYGLACFWSGRPHWFLHPCGMGETIGYAARLTQNNSGTQYGPTGSSPRGIHVALMGDPALRFHLPEPPRDLAASTANGAATLVWDATTEPGSLGFHVYRGASPLGPWTRLTPSPLAANTFTDTTAAAGQSATYIVRHLKLESVPGGTYRNLSVGSPVTLIVNGGVSSAPFNPSNLAAQIVNSTQTQLAWSDNSSDETGFRIERKTNATGTFASIGTVAANATAFTDPGPLAHGNVYFYRVVATGEASDSLSSNETSVDAIAGFYDMENARMKVPITSGSVQVPVNRFGATVAASVVTATTSDTSTTAGTHYTAVNTSVAFVDAANGPKNVAIPLLSGASPMLPRQLRLTLSAPTAGGSLAQQTYTRVLLTDPAATLPAPWLDATIGSVTDSAAIAYGESATFGSALIGGSTGTSDNGRFLYQPRTGDGVLTAFIDNPQPTQSASIFAAMVRSSNSSNAIEAAVTVEGDTGGTNFSKRTTAGGTPVLTPNNSNNLRAPRWVRLTRAGDVFTAEHSSDGTTWIILDCATVPVSAAANWGLFHVADGSSDFQLARFRNVTLANLSIPSAPTSLAATSPAATQVSLTWGIAPGGAQTYAIERQADGGSWTTIGSVAGSTLTYSDTTATADTAYRYRVSAVNSAGTGTPSAQALIATAPASGGSVPLRPGFLTSALVGDTIALQWSDLSSNEANFQVERRLLNGTWELIASPTANATALSDTNAALGITHEYRVRASNASGNSAWSATITAIRPTGFQSWLTAHGLPSDGSGQGAPDANPAGDGIRNLMKCALGLTPTVPGYGGRFTAGKAATGGSDYLTLTYTRPDPAPPGMQYVVETTPNVSTWDSVETVLVSTNIQGATATVTVRDSVPIGTLGSPGRSIRLRVVSP